MSAKTLRSKGGFSTARRSHLLVVAACLCLAVGPSAAQIAGEWPFNELETGTPPRIVSGGLQDDPLFRLGYLNVVHYGAIPDDGIDDTQSIQAAMDEGYLYDYVVYFPSGTYLVSDTLKAMQRSWYVGSLDEWIPARRKAHVLVGEKNQPVVLKLVDSSPGFNSPSSPKAMIQMWAQDRVPGPIPPGTDIDDQSGSFHFNQHIRGIDFDLRSVDNAGAVAIRFWGAQGGSLEDIHIEAAGAFAGFFDLPGTGGGVYNVRVNGGRYGIYVGEKKGYTTVAGITLINQSTAAIFDQEFKPMTVVGFHIVKEQGPAIVIGNKCCENAHGPVLVDGIIELEQGGRAVDNLYGIMTSMENVYIRNATSVIRSGTHPTVKGSPAGWVFVQKYAATHEDESERMSTHLLDGQLSSGEVMSKVDNATAPPPASEMLARHVWNRAGFPSFEDGDVANARDHGVVGDGQTDDTAALQAIIDSTQKIFLPRGIYLVSDTLRLKPDTQLVGVHPTFARIRPDVSVWQPQEETTVLLTEDDAYGATTLAFLGIDLPTSDLAFIRFNAVHWRVGRASMVRNLFLNDFGFTEETASNEFRNYKITNGGGGRWYGVYAGNNIKRHSLHPESRDVLVDGTTEPLRLYAFNSERGQAEPQSEIRRSANVAIFGFKSEGNQTPLRVDDSTNILVFGYGGNAAPLQGRSVFDIDSSADVLISNLGPFLRSPARTPYGQPMGDTLIGVNVDPALSYSLRERVAGQDIAVERAQSVARYNRGFPTLSRLLLAQDGNVDPVAGISITATHGNAPLSIGFDGTGSIDADGVVVSHQWDFGDGFNAAGATVQHQYSSAGTYLATLTVFDDLGASASTGVVIEVVQAPVEFVIDNLDANTVTSGHWQSSSSGGNWKRQAAVNRYGGYFRWLPQFPGPGFYDVYAWWASSNRNSSSVPFTVQHAGGSTTTHVNQRSWINSGRWNHLGRFYFDPSSSQHVEVGAGSFGYAEADAVRFIPVATNAPPTAVAQAGVDIGEAPLQVSFDASGSTDPDGSIVAYQWDFGDGSSVESGAQVVHSFVEGSYSVVLTVTDGSGSSDSDTIEIDVLTPGPPGGTNEPPQAGFVATPASGDAPLAVTFDASSSEDTDGSVVLYAWDFGNGATGTGVTASHSYTGSGSFTATLTVTDDDGDSDSTVQVIQVSEPPPPNEPPQAGFVATPTSGDAPLAVTFDASSSEDTDGSVVLYAWDFGDGATDTGVTASHSYTGSGSFTATLTVTDDDGDSDSTVKTIQVSEPGPAAVEFVIDNLDANTVTSGHWQSSSSGGNWKRQAAVNRYGGYFRWLPQFPGPGFYDVYAWWASSNRNSTSVPFTVQHAGGSTTTRVNQRSWFSSGRWNYLGRFYFDPSTSQHVEVGAGSFGYAEADAVRFVPVQ